MSSDTEKPDPYPPPKLPLFSIPPPHHSHSNSKPSGTSTPPFQTTVSVPFQWEEQPGKPRPCTDIILTSTNTHHMTQCLHLPPRLLTTVDPTTTTTNNKILSPSPTTVLHGLGEGGGKLFFSSFRVGTERRRRGRRRRSFDSNGGGGWSDGNDDDDGGCEQQKRLLLGGKDDGIGGGLFGSFRFKGKCKVTSSLSSVTSARDDGFVKGRKMRRNGSVPRVSGSRFWAKIYEGFKQVVPWRKKPKMEWL